MAAIQLMMSNKLFVRNPQETELGRKIVQESILMIDELGFEKFTFRKLAIAIDSTEASIYRYFENKHRLLVYLIAWYWNWLEYKIDYNTQNIDSALQKLKIAIKLVGQKKKTDMSFPQINESALYRIVIAESDKTYHTKQVDEDNDEGLFRGFKSLCDRIASYIIEVNPSYPYPHSLVSTILEAANQQLFFASHLPSLTELDKEDQSINDRNVEFLTSLVLSAIKNYA